jgi:peptidyl-prolyl cis-trans isomerase C
MTVFSASSPRAVFRALTIAATFAVVLSPSSRAQEVSAETPVAIVDGVPITAEDLAIAAQDFGEQLAQLPPERQTSALIDAIIDIRLLAKAAEVAAMDKEALVARRLEFVRNRTLRNEYLKAKVFQAVTDEAVKKRYDEEVAKFVPGDELHLLHILVKTEDEGKAIIADLDKGGDFAAIAKEKSTDPGSGPKGGDLGFIKKGQTVKPFEDAAFALDAGTYSKAPVKSDFGWHVIKLEEKRKEPPPALEAETPRLRQEMVSALFKSEIEKLRAAAKIEIVPPPAATPPADSGGAAPAQ